MSKLAKNSHLLLCTILLVGCSDSTKPVFLGIFDVPNNYSIKLWISEEMTNFEDGYYLYEYQIEKEDAIHNNRYCYWLSREYPGGQFKCKVIDFEGVQHAFIYNKQDPETPQIALNLQTGKTFDTATVNVGVYGKIPEKLVTAFREQEPLEHIKDRLQNTSETNRKE